MYVRAAHKLHMLSQVTPRAQQDQLGSLGGLRCNGSTIKISACSTCVFTCIHTPHASGKSPTAIDLIHFSQTLHHFPSSDRVLTVCRKSRSVFSSWRGTQRLRRKSFDDTCQLPFTPTLFPQWTSGPSATMEPIDVVWLKKDIRLHDHGPLSVIAQSSPRQCIILYLYEPDQVRRYIQKYALIYCLLIILSFSSNRCTYFISSLNIRSCVKRQFMAVTLNLLTRD
jgi:hypothetical protein